MKKRLIGTAFVAVFCSIAVVSGQGTSPAASPASSSATKRPEVYSVTFIHAASGKIKALEDWGKKSSANASGSSHTLLLRHEAGSPWDYAAVQHIGTKATVEASGNPNGQALRPLMDWHDDTFANGPTWAEFAKAMDLDNSSGKPKSAESVYVLSVYRPVVGQDDALEKVLAEPPAANDLTAGTVILQHLEGGAWRFLTIVRYKNYADYGKSEAAAVAETAKGSGGWYDLREVCSFHNDTIAAPVAP